MRCVRVVTRLAYDHISRKNVYNLGKNTCRLPKITQRSHRARLPTVPFQAPSNARRFTKRRDGATPCTVSAHCPPSPGAAFLAQLPRVFHPLNPDPDASNVSVRSRSIRDGNISQTCGALLYRAGEQSRASILTTLIGHNEESRTERRSEGGAMHRRNRRRLKQGPLDPSECARLRRTSARLRCADGAGVGMGRGRAGAPAPIAHAMLC